MMIEKNKLMPKKLFDVNFTLDSPMCLTIEASGEEEAYEIAEQEIEKLSKEELIERFLETVGARGWSFDIEEVG